MHDICADRSGVHGTQAKVVRSLQTRSLFALSLTLPFLLFGCMTEKELIIENSRRGNIIVHALYEFAEDSGSFPLYLAELSPRYLTDIPTTARNESFFYNRLPSNMFVINFPVRRNMGCGYILGFEPYSDVINFQRWGCGYGHP